MLRPVGQGLPEGPLVGVQLGRRLLRGFCRRDQRGHAPEFFQDIVDRFSPGMLASMTGKLSTAIFPNLGLIHNQVRVWRPIGLSASGEPSCR